MRSGLSRQSSRPWAKPAQRGTIHSLHNAVTTVPVVDLKLYQIDRSGGLRTVGARLESESRDTDVRRGFLGEREESGIKDTSATPA